MLAFLFYGYFGGGGGGGARGLDFLKAPDCIIPELEWRTGVWLPSGPTSRQAHWIIWTVKLFNLMSVFNHYI